jgi:hypothetical protein
MDDTSDNNRREFLRAVGRAIVGGLLGGGTLLLASRRQGTCANAGFCADCRLLEGCTLPTAEVFRRSAGARPGSPS